MDDNNLTLQLNSLTGRERLLAFADYIETLKHGRVGSQTEHPFKFSMASYHYCDTPSCIAGHAAWLAGVRRRDDESVGRYYDRLRDTAAEWLSLDKPTYQALFYPGYRWHSITPTQAATAIRKVANEVSEPIWGHLPAEWRV